MDIKILKPRLPAGLAREQVFSMMDCREDSPVYEDVVIEYDRLEPWLYENVRPEALMAMEPLEVLDARQKKCLGLTDGEALSCRGLLYLVLTIGRGPEQKSSELFAQGEYLAGMLLSAMADEFVFGLEDGVLPEVRAFLAGPGYGVLRRLEAPADMPLKFHQYVYERCGLKQRLGMDLSSGYMFDPVKTSCLVFLLSDDPSVFHGWHDCSRCPAADCPRRRQERALGTVLQAEPLQA